VSVAAGLPEDVLAHLAAMLASLAPSEQRVGRAVLSMPADAARLTISELARAAETSETTVVRFCRSLGLGSYSDLRIGLATSAGRAGPASLPRLAPDIDAADDLAAVVAKTGAADLQAVSDTVANLDLASLGRAVSAVSEARRTDIYGVAASGMVALDLQLKLHRIGLTAFAWSDPHLAVPSAANLSEADVAVAISHGGATDDTLDALGRARDAGATTIAITNRARSAIVSLADIVLRTSVPDTSENAFRSGAMASRRAELVVVDCLFIAIAQRRYEGTLAALARTREAVRSRHRGHARLATEGRRGASLG
jgi:DNA-binding MurR/RpiR family transcriptional regulator